MSTGQTLKEMMAGDEAGQTRSERAPDAQLERSVYAPERVVNTLVGPFFRRRRIRPAGEAAHTLDRVIAAIEDAGLVRVVGERLAPRGQRTRFVALVLGGGRYTSPKELVELLEKETAAALGEPLPADLDELMVVAEASFFEKKTLVEQVHALQRTQDAAREAAGAPSHDPDGTAAHCTAYSYSMFVCDVLSNAVVAEHRILSDAEAAERLAAARLTAASLPLVHVGDPTVVWLGGRRGQVVQILRDSQTAHAALYYRRIV